MKASELIEKILDGMGLDAFEIIEKIKSYDCDVAMKVSTPSYYRCDICDVIFREYSWLGLERQLTIVTKGEEEC